METLLTQQGQAVISKRKKLVWLPRIIIAAAVLLVISGVITGYVNSRRTGSWAGPGSNLTVVFILLIIFGFILLFVGVLLGYIWAKENQAVKSMLSGTDVLAHWTYSTEMSGQFGAIEMARLKWQLYLVKMPLALMGLGCLGWLLAGEHTIRMFLFSAAVGAGVGLLLGLLSLLTGYFQALQVPKQATGDVYITKQGVLSGDTYHHWDTSNQRLRSVIYEATSPAVLQFNYFVGTSPILSSISTATLIADYATEGEVGYKTNLSAEFVRVPVPPGKEQAAQEIAAMFSS